ncbi:MAG TPA: NADPH-dependent F420 reductase [Anaerolineaceae bacterium]|nr:NADPH-dependent F420 reductase [Anaerolineaceae bacterium]
MTDTPNISVHKIALIGGTGKEGKGLAYRWAKAGYDIVIGSRQIEKAQATAAELLALIPDARIEGLTNDAAALAADLLVLTVPFGAHAAMCEAIRPYAQGKVVIDVTVPLVPPKVTKVQMPPAGSAAQEAQQILGDQVSVVAAFQNISYEHLLQDETVNCDVLVCGTGKSARQVVLNLVAQAGMIGWDAGPIENSVVAEGLTSVLIGLNKQFDTHSAGIRITGVPRPDQK